MKKVFVFDLDGTLANFEHRLHLITGEVKDWRMYSMEQVNDTVYPDMVWMYRVLQNLPDSIMLIASGRGEENRINTKQWLSKNQIWYNELFMRPAGLVRNEELVKLDILQTIRNTYGEPCMVFDDRDIVSEMYRDNNVRCLQITNDKINPIKRNI